jgi:hypothetical protein
MIPYDTVKIPGLEGKHVWELPEYYKLRKLDLFIVGLNAIQKRRIKFYYNVV